jgi:hypothetical protein
VSFDIGFILAHLPLTGSKEIKKAERLGSAF